MKTVAEVEEALKEQTRRHEVLKTIIQLIDELAKDDEDGAVWVQEQLCE